MDNIAGILRAMYCGFVDSLKGATVLFYMDKQINERILKNSPAKVLLKKDSGLNNSPAKLKEPKESKILKRTIQCCMLNGGDIADSAYRHRQGRPLLLSSVSKLVADTLFSILVQALFLGQGMLVSQVPLPAIGELLELIHMCLLYALYAFEYKWFNMGWELHRRLTFIEANWPYFVGFGFPLAVLTQLPNSYVISGCVFSILFPLFIVSGNEAQPVTNVCDCPLKLFSPVIAIANTLFNKTIGPANRR
ncbi:hypothetical protein G9C98_000299 [Cotesia typhae]|uniref:Uncharacterized protein n=1 Tax=Cotesia typhae TaxID=2053667 RepID=A0A8J5R600_9HYME|nr:hypothetical protein G9C98_000299 [Cotesia typhae]